MKLVLDDGEKLDFDSVELIEGPALLCKRTGFEGLAVGIEVGDHLFLFRNPSGFSVKGVPLLVMWLSRGDVHDQFHVTFNL